MKITFQINPMNMFHVEIQPGRKLYYYIKLYYFVLYYTT